MNFGFTSVNYLYNSINFDEDCFDISNNCSLILEYIIGLKTGIGLGAGTDSLFSFTFISPFKKNVTFIVDGSQEGTLEAGKYVF